MFNMQHAKSSTETSKGASVFSDALHAKCEEQEPAVKVLASDVAQFLAKDAATCLQVSEKLLALGSKSGTVHLLDYEGNQVRCWPRQPAARPSML